MAFQYRLRDMIGIEIQQIMSEESVADPSASKRKVIEVHVQDLERLFKSIDPSPFRDRDIPLALLVYLDRALGAPDEVAALAGSAHEFFRQRAQAHRRRLRDLFSRDAKAKKSATLADIPTNHNPRFAPVIHPTFLDRFAEWIARFAKRT